jgi:tetratricopeptide (TPR) repeat protein
MPGDLAGGTTVQPPPAAAMRSTANRPDAAPCAAQRRAHGARARGRGLRLGLGLGIRMAVGAGVAAGLLSALGPAAAPAAAADDLLRLLERRSCPGCRLQDADLVHADLRDADLRNARLQRANLSRARLDGAQLQGADLRFTSLQGASLRGADLRGALLEGSDLRHSDLSAALIDPGALSRSHWDEAIGIAPQLLGYADLHNAAVRAANAGRFPEAETLFGEAIGTRPEAAVSWVGRGISRNEQGKSELAAQDLRRAAVLLEQGGDPEQAQQLRQAAAAMVKPDTRKPSGNGIGGQLLNGAASMATMLAPLAVKFLVPLAF